MGQIDCPVVVSEPRLWEEARFGSKLYKGFGWKL